MPRLPGKNSPRPKPSYGTRRPIHYGSENIIVTGRGDDRYVIVVATVKTGSDGMVKRLEKFADMNGIGFEAIGADEGRNTHCDGSTPRRLTVYWTDHKGNVHTHTTEQAPPDDSRATSEYLLWGDGETLATFLDRNTGDGKPIRSWSFNVPVRVTGAQGSGPCDKGTPTFVRVRDSLRSKDESRARFDRREPETVTAVSRDDRETRARTLATHWLPVFVDVRDMPSRTLATLFEDMVDFCRAHSRRPESSEEFHRWRLS